MNDLCTTSAEPLPLTLNRDFKMADGDWIQLARPGEVRAPLEGATRAVEVVQVLDAPAFEAIVNRFRTQSTAPNFPGLLVDFDHFSHDTTKESRAAAWITELAQRPEGLFAKARFSATGRAAIEGGDYRLVSPVFAFSRRAYTPGEKVRPIGLQSAGLTNDPRIKGMIPISNRDSDQPRDEQGRWTETGASNASATAFSLTSDAFANDGVIGVTPEMRKYNAGRHTKAADAHKLASEAQKSRSNHTLASLHEKSSLSHKTLADSAFKTLNRLIPISNRNGISADAGNNQPEPTMKDINKALGLAEDAPEASALATLQLITNRASSAETERDALKAERDTLLAAQVEADLNTAGLKGEARTRWQAALVANRASALGLLAALGKDDSGYAVTHNRSKKPDADASKPEETAAARQLSAVSDYKAKNRCSFQIAWEAVRIEKPELFAEASAE